MTWAALVLLVVAPARAQTLDLDARPGAPELQQTFASYLIGELQDEIAALPAPESIDDSAEAAIIAALVGYRVLAADLMAVGDHQQQAGSLGVVSGFRLARGRDDLERVLRRLQALDRDGADAAVFDRALLDIRKFSARAREQGDALRDVTGDELAARLARIMAPLVDAMTTLDAAPAAEHWVVLEATADDDATPVGLDALRERVAAAPLDDQIRAEMARIIEFLERGRAFSEWRTLVLEYRRLLEGVVDLAEATAAATWLSDEDRDAYAARMRDAVERFREPETREAGLERLAALEVSCRVIEAINVLADRWRVRRREPDLARGAIDVPGDDGVPARLGDLETLAGILEAMIEYRRLGRERIELPRELRVPHKELEKSYERAEDVLLEELGTTTAGAGARLTDPAFSSLLTDHRQYLADLRRIRRIPAWLQLVATVDPASADLFATDVRRLSRALLDDNRRPDAIRALNRLETQLERYFPMPFETELRPATPAAIVATGALHEPLAERIDTERRQWIEAWTEGDAAEAERAMELLYRLTGIMADTAPITAREGDATLLNRWAMWELPGGVIARPMSDLPARLKLATAAAVDGDFDGLARQLDGLERDAPLTRLAGRLLANLEPSLEALPSDARSPIGQTAHPPRSAAWLVHRRADLANLCRYTMEMEYARLTGQTELAEQLRAYVHGLAEDILAEVSQ